jgi:hypothetical protein
MLKRLIGILAVVVIVVLPLGTAHSYEVMRGYTGVVVYDEVNAKTAYTLLATASEYVSYLIDMKGNIVHQWDLTASMPLMAHTAAGYTDGPQVETVAALRPGLHDRLLVNGHLLRGYQPDTYATPGTVNTVAGTGKVNINPGGGSSGGVLELTWDNQLVWFYVMKDPTHIQHHTFYRVEDPNAPNYGNTFLLGWELKTPAECIAQGRITHIGPVGIYPDYIVEVNPAKQTVWEWHVWDHLGANNPAKFDVNAQIDPVNQSDADWTHGNTVEYNPVTGQLIFNSRNWGEFFIIDHDGTFVAGNPTQSIANAAGPGGDITFRWGNPGNYGAGNLPRFIDDGDQVIFGEHCVVWLGVDAVNAAGTPGNILIFDNGWNRPTGNRSRSVEMKPNYSNWLDKNQMVWNYASVNESSFYTAYQGGTGRIYQDATTGEKWTFVTSTGEGQLFQVYTNAQGKNSVVWDFVMPAIDPATGKRRCYHDDGTNNSIHRAHQYLPTYAGLAGKDLSITAYTEKLTGDCPPAYLQFTAPGTYETPIAGFGYGRAVGGGGGGAGGAGGAGGGGGY